MTGRRLWNPGQYAAVLVLTSAVTAVLGVINHYLSIPNISLLYLPVILLAAAYYGRWPALAAAALAALEYDFFLLRPAFTFVIAGAQDVLAFFIFVVVAVITSELAAEPQERALAAQRRERESATLYELGQALMSSSDLHNLLQAISERIVEAFDATQCAIFVPDADGSLTLTAETLRGSMRRGRASEATANWVYHQGTEVGVATDGHGSGGRQETYIPLRTADRTVGVMEVGPKRSGTGLDTEERGLITSFAAQAALVIARAQGEEERQRLRVVEESDRLKSALLAAVSHDLRTPLASIKASATSLMLSDTSWTSDAGRELLQAIDQEADRLNRLVGNLLDLSRIEAGALKPELEWYDIREVVETALPRLQPLLENRAFTIEIPPEIPAVQLDLLRIEELLINLVENAAKYAPAESPIAIRVRHDADGLHLAVIDHGPGVPEHQRQRIFGTFYRLNRHSDRDPGSGLGLAICRGIAEAHGGRIRVDPTPGGGATFMLTLPRRLLNEAVPT